MRTFGVSYASGTDVRVVTNSLGWITMTCEVEHENAFPTESQLRSVLTEVGEKMQAHTIVPVSVFPLGTDTSEKGDAE